MAGSFSIEFPQTSRLLPVRTLPRIRLDRAQRASAGSAAIVANFSTVFLYNNSPQSHYLVVRGLHWGPAASGPVILSYAVGNPGGSLGTANQPVLPDRAKLPGVVTQNALSGALNPDFTLYLQSLEQAVSGEYPMIVLPPNWQIAVQCQTVNLAMTCSFLWEALTPDEFTEMYGQYV